MSTKPYLWFLIVALLSGCDWPGQPNVKDKFVAPTKVTDFAKLYAKNCAGCHGKDGDLGPAPPLNDAVFLAIIPDDELIKTISAGRKGTSMPAFAVSQGGTLTDEQIRILAKGLQEKTPPAKGDWPAYELPAIKGDKDRGAVVFARACAACHGDNGTGTKKLGPINDQPFLALASEQMLRRIIITGRADLGMPNCSAGEGRPIGAPEVNDLVALMMSWKR